MLLVSHFVGEPQNLFWISRNASLKPKLSASKLKEIILESGVDINLSVKIPGKDRETVFKSLSKTGKIVNAYNALILASKSKRK